MCYYCMVWEIICDWKINLLSNENLQQVCLPIRHKPCRENRPFLFNKNQLLIFHPRNWKLFVRTYKILKSTSCVYFVLEMESMNYGSCILKCCLVCWGWYMLLKAVFSWISKKLVTRKLNARTHTHERKALLHNFQNFHPSYFVAPRALIFLNWNQNYIACIF